MFRSVLRPTRVIGLVAALLTPAIVVAATPSVADLETELVPPFVHRIVDDGADHPLTIGGEVDEFHDLLVTSDGSVVVSSLHDGRVQNGAFDAWPMRVWTLGQPGVSNVLVPTAHSGLAEGPDGALYLAGEGWFLARLDGTEWEILHKQQDVTEYYDHVVGEDGIVWAAFGPKLYSFDGESWIRSKLGGGGRRVTSLERSADGNLWAHVGDRLLRLDGGQWLESQPREAPRPIKVLGIDADAEGTLWGWLDSGIDDCDPVRVAIDPEEWVPAAAERLLSSPTTSALDSGQKQRRCTFHGEVPADSDWAVLARAIEDWTDSIGPVTVRGPRTSRHVAADGDGNIWVLTPDGDPQTSDLFVIETGAGD